LFFTGFCSHHTIFPNILHGDLLVFPSPCSKVGLSELSWTVHQLIPSGAPERHLSTVVDRATVSDVLPLRMLSSFLFPLNRTHVYVIHLLCPLGGTITDTLSGNRDNSYLRAAWVPLSRASRERIWFGVLQPLVMLGCKTVPEDQILKGSDDGV
jgi:hypothetical protein